MQALEPRPLTGRVNEPLSKPDFLRLKVRKPSG